MAKNFKIQISGTDRTFFFDLYGDFDGSSAFELLNQLQEKVIAPNQKAYVNTRRLRTIHPFGRDVFRRNLASITHIENIIFTGEFAPDLAPVEKTTMRWRQDAEKGFSFVNRLEASSSGQSRQIPAGGK